MCSIWNGPRVLVLRFENPHDPNLTSNQALAIEVQKNGKTLGRSRRSSPSNRPILDSVAYSNLVDTLDLERSHLEIREGRPALGNVAHSSSKCAREIKRSPVHYQLGTEKTQEQANAMFFFRAQCLANWLCSILSGTMCINPISESIAS